MSESISSEVVPSVTHAPNMQRVRYDLETDENGYSLYFSADCTCGAEQETCVWSFGTSLTRYIHGTDYDEIATFVKQAVNCGCCPFAPKIFEEVMKYARDNTCNNIDKLVDLYNEIVTERGFE
jgi:hypothetical protein